MQSAITPPNDGVQSIFIIGGMTGIGRDLARTLAAAGHRVTATCSRAAEAAALRADGITPAYPNLSRAGEIRSAIHATSSHGPVIVINLAPQMANVPPQLGAAFDAQLAVHTAALAEAAHGAQAAFLIHTSYAFLDAQPHGEAGEDAVEPAEALLTMARAAETAALAGGTPACVLRFGYVYGSGSEGLVKLAATLKAGRFVPPGDAQHHAAWVHQADAARAVSLAIAQRPAGQTITVTDGHPATPADFLTYFAEAQGLQIARGLPFLGMLIPAAHKALMALDFDGAATPADTALGWTPRYTDFRHGIDELLLSWRAGLAVKA